VALPLAGDSVKSAGERYWSVTVEVAVRVLIPLLIILAASHAAAQATEHQPRAAHDHAIYLKFQDIKWDKIAPELGDRSPEIAILHVDPTTQATKLMIRVPKDFHVPKHWHTANETHTVVSGTFIMEHQEGQRHELGPGSFNYVPSKAVHQAWTKPDEGTLLFITVDGAWDVNWVEGPPQAQAK
jgi:quercetin dioxygenase-like cupin family protein